MLFFENYNKSFINKLKIINLYIQIYLINYIKKNLR